MKRLLNLFLVGPVASECEDIDITDRRVQRRLEVHEARTLAELNSSARPAWRAPKEDPRAA